MPVRPTTPACSRLPYRTALALLAAGFLLGGRAQAAAGTRFVSLVPGREAGTWTAVLAVAPKGAEGLALWADGQALAVRFAAAAGGRVEATLEGVPEGARWLEAGRPGKRGREIEAAVPIGPAGPFADWVIYHVMLEMFRNGSAANDGEIRGFKHPLTAGGDLQGVLEKVDYIAALGASAVWLSPLFAADTSHGYDVKDYFRVGDAVAVPGDAAASGELFGRLLAAFHERGIKVLLDLPLNHASRAYDREHGDPKGLRPRATAARQEAERLWESWGAGYRYWDFDHPPTREFLRSVARHWLAAGADGFRLDYARGVPHDFWAELYADVKGRDPRVLLLGECWIDAGSPEVNAQDIATYTVAAPGAGRQFDSLLDFPLQMALTEVFARGAAAWGLEERLQADAALYGPAAEPAAFLDNHDLARFLAWAADPRKLVAAVTYLASLPGPVVLFYGTEAGLTHANPRPGFTDAGRIPMPWDPPDGDLAGRLRATLAARREHPVLARGARLPLHADRETLVMARRGPEGLAFVGVNLAREPRTVTFPAGGLVHSGMVLTAVVGDTLPVAAGEGRMSWELPPLATGIAAAQAGEPTISGRRPAGRSDRSGRDR